MKSFKNYVFEASLQGSTTSYSGSHGAFKQYVELGKTEIFQLEKPAELYQMDGTPMDETLKKGTQLKIMDREVKYITKVGRSDAIRCQLTDRKYRRYTGQDFLIHLNKILKPSGKNVEVMAVDLNDKINPNVFTPFKAGHGHEGQFTEAWIKGSGDNWQFEYKGTEYKVLELRAPKKDWSGGGNPKTDVTVVLDKTLAGFKTNMLKYSLKSINATYFENWMLPARWEQIFGKKRASDLINGILKELNETGKIGGTTTKTPNVAGFIAKKFNYGSPLSTTQAMEVLTGNVKFGVNGEGSANMFYGGDVPKKPDMIQQMIKGSQMASKYAGKLKAGLSIRGSTKPGNYVICTKGEEGKWFATEQFIKLFDIDKEYHRS
tara:strand:+ start:542 stop:1669 length:1128 start_codon:yes stop_codon:yes gene_type:complete